MITTEATYSAPNTDAPPPAYAVGDQVALAADGLRHAGRVGQITQTIWYAEMRSWLYELVFDADEEPFRVTDGRIVGVQGRLAALDADPAPPAQPQAAKGALVELPLAWIEPDAHNERTDLAADLDDLEASMKERGLLEPIRVYKVAERRVRIASGHRRHAAALALGWLAIPAIIVPPPATADDATLDRLVANLHRRDLTALEEARGYAALAAAGRTQKEIGKAVGKSQPHVANLLRLLELPDAVQAHLAAGTLTAQHGLELLRLTEGELDWNGKPQRTAAEEQTRWAEMAVKQEFSAGSIRIGIKRQLDQNASIQRQQEYNRKVEERAAATRAERLSTPAGQAEEQERQEAEQQRLAKQQHEESIRAQRKEIARQVVRAQRKEIARQVVRAALDQEEGEPPTEATWQALAAYLFYNTGTATQARLGPALEAAPDADSLLPIVAELILEQFQHQVGWDGTAFSAHFGFSKWAEQQFGLNARLTVALNKAGVGTGRAPEGAPDRAPEAAEGADDEDDDEIPTHCPNCEVELVQAEGEIICPDCEEVYGYVEDGDEEDDA